MEPPQQRNHACSEYQFVLSLTEKTSRDRLRAILFISLKRRGYINHPHWSSFPFGYFIVCLFIFFPIITTATSMLLNTTVQFLSAYNLYLKDVCRVKDKDRRKVAPNKSRCPILRRVRPFEVPVYRSLTVTEP